MSLVTFTQQLLENLVAERPSIEEQQRSVIFICQSLGSLVFKQAYFLAPEDTHYMDLQSKFGSIVFFGTLPHRGSNIASWSKMAALKRLELASLNTSNTQLAKDLEPSSKKLRYIWRCFTGYAPEILGVADEVVIADEGDHRSMMCRFSDAEEKRFRPVVTRL